MTGRILSRHDKIRLLLESHQDYLPPMKIARYGNQAASYSDPYIHQAAQEKVDEQPDRSRDNLRELERLNRELGLDTDGHPVRDNGDDPIITRRQKLWAEGDYAALEAAMRALHHEAPFYHRVLTRVYIDHLRVASVVVVDDAITQLGFWMPEQVRIPGWLADRNGETLHVRVRLLAATHPGKSQSWIARKAGCNQATVSRALAVLKGQVA